jgi:hypothetical protein
VRRGGGLDFLAAVCRIPIDGKVPHPTALMKLTTCSPAGRAADADDHRRTGPDTLAE